MCLFFLQLEHAVEASVQVNQRSKDMTEEVTKQVYQALLARSKNDKLGKKDTRIVADHFGLHIRSVQRSLKEVKYHLLIAFRLWLLVEKG